MFRVSEQAAGIERGAHRIRNAAPIVLSMSVKRHNSVSCKIPWCSANFNTIRLQKETQQGSGPLVSSLTSCSGRYRNHKTHAMGFFPLHPAVVSPIGLTTSAGGAHLISSVHLPDGPFTRREPATLRRAVIEYFRKEPKAFGRRAPQHHTTTIQRGGQKTRHLPWPAAPPDCLPFPCQLDQVQHMR